MTGRRYTGATARLEHWTNASQQPITAAATLLGRPSPGRPADEVDIVEGSVESGMFVADYRRDGKPVAVCAMNMPRPFGRRRRELAFRLS